MRCRLLIGFQGLFEYMSICRASQRSKVESQRIPEKNIQSDFAIATSRQRVSNKECPIKKFVYLLFGACDLRFPDIPRPCVLGTARPA